MHIEPIERGFLQPRLIFTRDNASHGTLNGKALTLSLVSQVQDICIIPSLDSDNIIILRALQHFCETAQVDTQGHGSIATVFPEANRVQSYRYESHVGVVHSLEVDAFFVTFKVGVCYQLFDS